PRCHWRSCTTWRRPGPRTGTGRPSVARRRGPRARAATRGDPCALIAPLASPPRWAAACGPCRAPAARPSSGAISTTQGGNMDRQAWLDQRRAAVLTSYDQDAATYDDHGYPTTAQQDWVARLLRVCPPAATILDAPCGTGQYFPWWPPPGTAS